MIPYKTHQNQAINVWFIPKPLSMAVFCRHFPAAGRWDKLLVTSTAIVVTAGSRHYQSLWAKHDWWWHALYQSIIFLVGKGGCVSLMMFLPCNVQTKRDFSDDAWEYYDDLTGRHHDPIMACFNVFLKKILEKMEKDMERSVDVSMASNLLRTSAIFDC